jgi:predicted nucleic acid-binding protein
MQRSKPAPVSVATAQVLLSRFRNLARVSFVADDVDSFVLPADIIKHGETTDAHLLALARRHGAQLITFDTGITGAHQVP